MTRAAFNSLKKKAKMVNALYITALFNASVKTKDDGMFGQGCLLEGLQSRELYILHTSRAKIRGPHDHCFFMFRHLGSAIFAGQESTIYNGLEIHIARNPISYV